MTNENDTIAAIATAVGEGGISIVRISGRDAIEIADKVFKGRRKLSGIEGGCFVFGQVFGSDNKTADEVIALVYREPRSYTRENVVEFQCHGGNVSVRRVLSAVLDAGARPAQPGEFTKRAFLNGRIDLVQAEAVADIVRAKSDRAALAALEQLEGRLGSEINRIYEVLIELAADIEASLDFEEEHILSVLDNTFYQRAQGIKEALELLLKTWNEGQILREGAVIAIAGRPNAGKSTMLNVLIGKDRAIVDHEPGTTRDTLEEQTVIEGFPVCLIDTAGLRETSDRIENKGIERAISAINKADLVLYVIDASVPIDSKEREFLQSSKWRRCVVVLNKIDIRRIIHPYDFCKWPVVECSLAKGTGVDEVKKAIIKNLDMNADIEPHAVISERHRIILQEVLRQIRELYALNGGAFMKEPAIAAWHIRQAALELGKITGKDYSEELLDQIFNKFCVGK